MDGWIKLHRKIVDSCDWLHESFTRSQAWIDMILLANHAPGTIRTRGIIVKIERGQLGWSEEKLAKRWKWSRGKVRRFFSELSSETVARIVQQKTTANSVITIVNYDTYQSDDTEDDTQSSTPNGHQTDIRQYTNKKNKKNKKNKNDNTNTNTNTNIVVAFSDFEVEKEDGDFVKITTQKKFVIPTISELVSFLKTIGGSEFDANDIFDYYESKGWRVGNSAMKSWEASARRWMRNKRPEMHQGAHNKAEELQAYQSRISKEIDASMGV